MPFAVQVGALDLIDVSSWSIPDFFALAVIEANAMVSGKAYDQVPREGSREPTRASKAAWGDELFEIHLPDWERKNDFHDRMARAIQQSRVGVSSMFQEI